MNFGFTEEQDELRAQVRRFLDQECPLPRVRELMAAADPVDRALWQQTAELGWLGLTLPESDGGLGLAWEDVVIFAEEMGRSLFPSPFLAHVAAQQAILRLGSPEQRARWLPATMDGSSIATLAVLEAADVLAPDGIEATATAAPGGRVRLDGRKLFVADGLAADLLLVAVREGAGVSLYAVPADAEGVAREGEPLFDQTKRVAAVRLDGVVVGESDRLGAPGAAWPVLEDVTRRALVAFAAETVGAADGALALAVGYAKVREQFGSVIGRFQGVKHRCADLHVEIESARSLVYYASYVVDQEPEQAARIVPMAVATAAEAADRAGEECIQLHGAIGFTWEHDAHLYYKRGRYARLAHGSPESHLDQVLVAQGL